MERYSFEAGVLLLVHHRPPAICFLQQCLTTIYPSSIKIYPFDTLLLKGSPSKSARTLPYRNPSAILLRTSGPVKKRGLILESAVFFKIDSVVYVRLARRMGPRCKVPCTHTHTHTLSYFTTKCVWHGFCTAKGQLPPDGRANLRPRCRHHTSFLPFLMAAPGH